VDGLTVSTNTGGVDDAVAIAALISDLYWQIDQIPRRGIKDNAGNRYRPSYYQRSLKNAIDQGGRAVVEYIRGYIYKAPSDGYRKLEEADSLDLASEALVADEAKPYAHLFSDADREAARARLAPHIEAIARRKAASRERIAVQRSELPADILALRELSEMTQAPETAIAINEAIVSQVPGDIAALNRLGRAYAAIGATDEARKRFNEVIAIDPNNGIATRRLQELAAMERSRSR
jgi:tetratricopeptide (TPR) repeat protein